jgi:glycosyltransferase involved in cell wall biosynthesis
MASRAIATVLLNVLFGVPYLALDALSGGQLDWVARVYSRWGAWARNAADAAGIADVYHGHDLSAVWAAILARRRYGGKLVYDSHEVYLEAGANGTRPRWSRWIVGKTFESPAWRRADAVITVNRAVAQVLHSRYGNPRCSIILHNCSSYWNPNPRPTELRDAIGVGFETPVALYHGGLVAVRGLWQMMTAIRDPRLSKIHLVFLGYGPAEADLREAAKDPSYGGRVHVVSAVSPEVLDRWVAGADVGLMPNQPETLNEIVSTPNKLFESISAGVPVVTSDFPERRRIVLDDPAGVLGEVCNPSDPSDLARAILKLVNVTPVEREAQRQRCLTAARQRWNWEIESERLVKLYEELVTQG